MAIETVNKSLDTAVISTSGLDVEISTYFTLDRYLGDMLTLPYKFEDVKIKSNELCTADNVNAALFKLHYNFLYLNAQTKIADNNFPRSYKGFIASDADTGKDEVTWYWPASAATSDLSEIGATGTALSGLVAGAFAQSIDSQSEYVGVVATSATLLGYRSNFVDDTASINLNKQSIEDASGLQFTNIKSMQFNSEKRLFVIDGSNIHKFNVDAVLTSNRAVSGIGRFLIKTIGGKSKNIYDKDKFNNPVSIYVDGDDDVYVLDKDDHGFKIYDKDLNWKRTASRKSEYTNLSGGSPVSIAVDDVTKNIFVLTDNGLLFEYTNEATLIGKTLLDDPLETDEQFKQITFSKKHGNIVYVMTDKSLFKKFKTKMSKSIGAFRLADNNITTQSLAFTSLMHADIYTYDYVHLGGNSIHTGVPSQVGAIFKFNEDINYKTLAHDGYKTDLYPLSAINIKESEFVTSWVINKSMHKLIYNHLLLRDNMNYKYVGQYDAVGRLQFVKARNLLDTDPNLFGYATDLDNFVGINEPMFADTINRPLHEIYKIQEKLIEMCNESITNKFPYASQVVEVK